MRDNQEKINFEQFSLLTEYVLKLDPIIYRNMVSNANNLLFKQQMDSLKNQPINNGVQNPVKGEVTPIKDGIQNQTT